MNPLETAATAVFSAFGYVVIGTCVARMHFNTYMKNSFRKGYSAEKACKELAGGNWLVGFAWPPALVVWALVAVTTLVWNKTAPDVYERQRIEKERKQELEAKEAHVAALERECLEEPDQ